MEVLKRQTKFSATVAEGKKNNACINAEITIIINSIL